MTDYTELQKAAAYAAQDTIKFADESEEMRALQQFHEEVDPETVLALIAENERLESEAVYSAAGFDAAREEVARLKDENEALRKSLSDCTNELAAEIICKHGGQKLEDMHPVTRRLYERDMAPVTEARAAMGKGEQS